MRLHVSPMSLMNSAAMVAMLTLLMRDSHYCRCVQVLKVVNLNIFMEYCTSVHNQLVYYQYVKFICYI